MQKKVWAHEYDWVWRTSGDAASCLLHGRWTTDEKRDCTGFIQQFGSWHSHYGVILWSYDSHLSVTFILSDMQGTTLLCCNVCLLQCDSCSSWHLPLYFEFQSFDLFLALFVFFLKDLCISRTLISSRAVWPSEHYEHFWEFIVLVSAAISQTSTNGHLSTTVTSLQQPLFCPGGQPIHGHTY